MKVSVECICPKCRKIWTDTTWKHQPRIRPWPSACEKHRALFDNGEEGMPDVTGTTAVQKPKRKRQSI